MSAGMTQEDVRSKGMTLEVFKYKHSRGKSVKKLNRLYSF